MRILFFDMEFANGKVPGSVYSLGYVMTDGNFKIKKPATDILINPESSWNFYVKKNILAYPMEEVNAAPAFPKHYKKIKRLFKKADVAVGFALGNDNHALRCDCKRYRLPQIEYRYFDAEPLCRLIGGYSRAMGLAKCVEEWCGRQPENQHRSDGDAYATMMLLEAVCRAKHATVEMMMEAYPECGGDTFSKEKRKRKKKGFFRFLRIKKRKMTNNKNK